MFVFLLFFLTRMSRDMFDRLVHMLAPNAIFHSPKKKQRHVKYQVAAFLVRYGQRGSDVLDVASKLGLGLGTVHLYCRRVTRALRELRSHHLGWLGDERKKLVSQRIEARSGFPKCAGSGDGCQIRMSTAPVENPDEFLSRKKEHSTNVQATVDDECRFTSFDLGWPGCVTDSKIFKYSHLWRHRHHYFKDGEYILVDKGTVSSYLKLFLLIAHL
ncbi:hypothetical protein BT96DRAFT_803896 [Gymnopus androsaceus JB14]|uniref:DDE Tnp4 domain-containing protein n=1 Tax=Gymnopus androsaceus JB14 TaxID=1447944 RepID=A0A6A4IRQ4_9AGAR|nr:hypothetical protein BT96DRAFT_803896 [Gymnopus androsaceus JB14]